MIKFIIEKFRQAPGPLQQPRVLIADLAEEIYDLASHAIKGTTDDGAGYSEPTQSAPAPSTVEADDKSGAEAQPAPPEADDKPKASIELDDRLAKSTEIPGNKRKQAFKVLAILWDAKQRSLDPMSAKALSKHGEKMGLSIRHENVRKVIRMRLEKQVNVHAQGAGNGTVYRYEISKEGEEHFTSTYFE